MTAASRTDAVRAADAKRQRRRRRRKDGGKKRFRIFADPDDLKVALQGSGALQPGEHHHRIMNTQTQRGEAATTLPLLQRMEERAGERRWVLRQAPLLGPLPARSSRGAEEKA